VREPGGFFTGASNDVGLIEFVGVNRTVGTLCPRETMIMVDVAIVETDAFCRRIWRITPAPVFMARFRGESSPLPAKRTRT